MGAARAVNARKAITSRLGMEVWTKRKLVEGLVRRKINRYHVKISPRRGEGLVGGASQDEA